MTDITPEFSRIISVARLSPQGAVEELEAKPAERQALAKRFDLVELSSLQARLTLQPAEQGMVEAFGTLTAKVVQRCVVTLEPLSSALEIEIDVLYIPVEEHKKGAGSPDPEELGGEFELFSHGKIDIGETVAQQLGINLDPYPRKAGAALTVTQCGAEVEAVPHPLAQLAEIGKIGKKPAKSIKSNKKTEQ